MKVRRVVVRLKTATGDGERQIAVLTSLPQTVALAKYDVAQLYRGGWSVETLFQNVNKNFEGNFFSLGYPKPEYFFCYNKVSYNILFVVRRAVSNRPLAKITRTGSSAHPTRVIFLVGWAEEPVQ